MSLLATASCDQSSGYYWRSGGVVRVWWCKGRALGRGWEGVADEGAPHENWRNSLATRERISTKWGSPFISNQTVKEPNDKDWEKEGMEWWGGGGWSRPKISEWLYKKTEGLNGVGVLVSRLLAASAIHPLKLVCTDINTRCECPWMYHNTWPSSWLKWWKKNAGTRGLSGCLGSR